MNAMESIFARRFPPVMGGVDTRGESAYRLSHYLYARRVLRKPATAALKWADELPAVYTKGREWYGPRGGAGAPFEQGGDSLRWIESTEEAGLRFMGWSDELTRLGHVGWYCDDEGRETLRGGVWQLPARKGKARLLYGYAEMAGREEMNPGSACICVSRVVEVSREEAEYIKESDDARDAARWADGLAESTAEDRRDYNSAYDEGRKAAELDGEALELRTRARAVAGAAKAHRRSKVGTAMGAALERTLADMLETISEKRAERDESWRDCPKRLEGAWLNGFMDESEGGFVRAVRLGYASREDWKGKPEANPCNREPLA